MAKSMMRHWAPFLLSILLSVAANRAEAQLVTVNFQGQTSGSPPVPISGTFTYNSSVTTDDNTFVFTGLPVSSGRHDIKYTISGLLHTGSGSACEPYCIQISGNQFVLTATLPKTPPTTVRNHDHHEPVYNNKSADVAGLLVLSKFSPGHIPAHIDAQRWIKSFGVIAITSAAVPPR